MSVRVDGMVLKISWMKKTFPGKRIKGSVSSHFMTLWT